MICRYHSRSGGTCRLKLPSAKNTRVLNAAGESIRVRTVGEDTLEFQTKVGEQIDIQLVKETNK
jgi:hypothetical protein